MRRGLALFWMLAMSGLSILPASAQQIVPPGAAAGPPSRVPQIIPDQYIVELHPGESVDAVAQGHGVGVLRRFGIINGFVAQMPHGVVTALSRDPRVLRVGPDLVVQAFAKPSSPPGKGKPGSGGGGGGTTTCPAPPAPTAEQIPSGVARIGAPSAWSRGDTGTGVRVAVIDTGIDLCHPDLAPNYLDGINYIDSTQPPKDDNGHGTHVSGIIAAQDNDTGVVGIAPNAKILAAKVLDASGSGSLSTVITALDWAVQKGARVANLSLAAADFWCTLGICGAGSECTAISNAVASGVVVVVAAGNSSDEALYYTPANCRDSLTVTAIDDSDDTFASFSNHSVYYWDVDGDGKFTIADHPVVDIMAPGVNILSTMPTYDVTLTTTYGISKNYGVLSGTSMATPHVAGAAALYIGSHSTATSDEVRRALVTQGECPGGGTTLGGPVCASGWLADPDGVWEPLVQASGL
jgi:subtilisin family serine protease